MGRTECSLLIHIDGGASGNPGPAGAGVIVQAADDRTILFEGGFFLGRATSNAAEYRALLEALSVAKSLNAKDVEVCSDSELLVRQMTGRYRVRNPGLRELFQQAEQLSRNFQRCTFRHIGRQENKAADMLVRRAINLKRNVEDAEKES